MAIARLGLSREEVDDLSPLELSIALDEHHEYHSLHLKQLSELVRYIGVTLTNKGIKNIIRNVKKFFPLFWDKEKKVEMPDWKDLDKKYRKDVTRNASL